MTFLEKWKEEHPDGGSGWPGGCPSTFGYEFVDCCTEEYCRNSTCVDCWNREIPEEVKEEKKRVLIDGKTSMVDAQKAVNAPHILDSGARREFGTGAVRDIQEGKGRCDLLPLDVVCQSYYDIGLDIAFSIFELIGYFKESGNTVHLLEVLKYFCEDRWDKDCNAMFLEVSIHFEEGAKKYGENNWQKGIPVRCYIDSVVRHYLKFLRGDKDEPHDRAFCWNIMCAIWTCNHMPELNDYAKRDISSVEEMMD